MSDDARPPRRPERTPAQRKADSRATKAYFSGTPVAILDDDGNETGMTGTIIDMQAAFTYLIALDDGRKIGTTADCIKVDQLNELGRHFFGDDPEPEDT